MRNRTTYFAFCPRESATTRRIATRSPAPPATTIAAVGRLGPELPVEPMVGPAVRQFDGAGAGGSPTGFARIGSAGDAEGAARSRSQGGWPCLRAPVVSCGRITGPLGFEPSMV